MATVRPVPRRLDRVPAALLVVLVACAAGQAIGGGGIIAYGLLGLAGLFVVGLAARAVIGKRLEPGFLTVEMPVLLVLTSTLVLRPAARSNEQLADNPLDGAAAVRVLCIIAAASLAAWALLSSNPGSNQRKAVTSLPTRLYLLYAAVALLGAPFSRFPLQTLYRVGELFVLILVVAGAYWRAGDGATRRLEAVLYWFLVGIIIVVWIGLAISPGRALAPRPEVMALRGLDQPVSGTNILDVNLVGVFPAWAANQVGAHGILLAVWSFARLVTPQRRVRPHRLALPLFILGLISLILAQYRTGYVAFVVGMALILGVRRRAVLMAGAVGVVAVLVLAPGLVASMQPYALRGQSVTEARQLSGRLDRWNAGLAAWSESPLIGRGLRTASRYEALTTEGWTTAAGIHSTWIEVLLGTGLLGLSFFVAALFVAMSRARRLARAGPILPLVILAVELVRTFTANTFDSSSVELVVFLVVANSLVDSRPFLGAYHPASEEPGPAALGGEGRRRSVERR